MINCGVCGVPIDIAEDDSYTVRLNAGYVPYYTCGGCEEQETESTSIVCVSELDLSEG